VFWFSSRKGEWACSRISLESGFIRYTARAEEGWDVGALSRPGLEHVNLLNRSRRSAVELRGAPPAWRTRFWPGGESGTKPANGAPYPYKFHPDRPERRNSWPRPHRRPKSMARIPRTRTWSCRVVSEARRCRKEWGWGGRTIRKLRRRPIYQGRKTLWCTVESDLRPGKTATGRMCAKVQKFELLPIIPGARRLTGAMQCEGQGDVSMKTGPQFDPRAFFFFFFPFFKQQRPPPDICKGRVSFRGVRLAPGPRGADSPAAPVLPLENKWGPETDGLRRGGRPAARLHWESI